MRLQDFMTDEVETIAPGVLAERALTHMQAHGVRHLVVTRGRNIVGVISERDLGGRRGASLRRGKTVADLMVRDPVCAPPTATVRQAANRLRGRGLGCLPVVEDERLVGIVTISDVLDLVGRGAARPKGLDRRRNSRKAGARRGSAPGV